LRGDSSICHFLFFTFIAICTPPSSHTSPPRYRLPVARRRQPREQRFCALSSQMQRHSTRQQDASGAQAPRADAAPQPLC